MAAQSHAHPSSRGTTSELSASPTGVFFLQDYMAEIADVECKVQVNRYAELAAEDIRFDVPLAEACQVDRQTLCGSVPPGSARVIRCLQVSGSCRDLCQLTCVVGGCGATVVCRNEVTDPPAPDVTTDTWCWKVQHVGGVFEWWLTQLPRQYSTQAV